VEATTSLTLGGIVDLSEVDLDAHLEWALAERGRGAQIATEPDDDGLAGDVRL